MIIVGTTNIVSHNFPNCGDLQVLMSPPCHFLSWAAQMLILYLETICNNSLLPLSSAIAFQGCYCYSCYYQIIIQPHYT